MTRRATGRAAAILGLVASLGMPREAATQRPRPPLPPRHRHADVRPWTIEDAIPEFALADTTLPRDAVTEDRVTDRRHRYEATTVADVSAAERTQRVRLFVVERATGRTREIRGLPFAWRPFSDLAWVDDRTLVFDRWSSPHAGMHYAVDVARGRLVAAVPFHDRVR